IDQNTVLIHSLLPLTHEFSVKFNKNEYRQGYQKRSIERQYPIPNQINDIINDVNTFNESIQPIRQCILQANNLTESRLCGTEYIDIIVTPTTESEKEIVYTSPFN